MLPAPLIDLTGIPPSRLSIVWQRKLAPISASAKARIERKWSMYRRQAKAAGKSLFNGAVTCMTGLHREKSRIVLQLAPAQYKQFVVTVLRDRPWFLKHAPDALRPAVGNSVLLTHKDTALLGLRSPRVSAYPNRFHLIGGVLDRLETSRHPASVPGILNHLRRELAEEIGATIRDLAKDPRLLTIVRDDFLGQPELVWQWETHLPLDRLAERLDPDEHAGYLLVSRNRAQPHQWRRFTPVAQAAYTLWNQCRIQA